MNQKIEIQRRLHSIVAGCLTVLMLLSFGSLVGRVVATEPVSVLSAALGSPAGGSGDSGAPVISPDGRYVLFASAAHNLVLTSSSNPIPTLSPARLNVYLKDRVTGLTELISVDPADTCGGDHDSFPAQISANGQLILFESAASNLIACDTNGVGDVFIRDRVAGTTVLISRAPTGDCGNGASHSPVMTPDGRLVAFASAASNLVADDTNAIADVFIHDVLLGATALVSVGAESATSFKTSASDAPQITPDGRFIAFYSTATNLVPGVSGSGEIYVRDLLFPITYWASINAQSFLTDPSPYSYNHQISSDGQYVAFQAGGLGINGEAVVLRHHLYSAVTEEVGADAIAAMSETLPNLENLGMTPNGQYIAFLSRETNNAVVVRRWNALTGVSELVSSSLSNTIPAGLICEWPVMDASGRYVAFVCNVTGVVTNSGNGTTWLSPDIIVGGIVGPGASEVINREYHLFIRDMMTTNTWLVDVNTNGMASFVGHHAVPSFSEDGTFITFEAPDGPLVQNDHNSDIDVFAKDLTTEAIELISAHHPDLPSLTPNGPSLLLSASVSSNGQFVAFASDADNLVEVDTNRMRDVFVRDVLVGTNVLVTVSTNGGSANGISTEPAISGDGRYVAFTSYADNLVLGDPNKARDVFVRDLQSGTILLVSLSTDGVNSGSAESFEPALSEGGRYVLYQSASTDLAPGSFTGGWNLFFRDTMTATNQALTDRGVMAAALTPDGHYVAFFGEFDTSPFPPAGQSVFVWERETASIVYDYPGFLSWVDEISISADGQRIAFLAVDATLQVVDRETGTNRTVATGTFPSGIGMRFSHDGRYLAYAQHEGNSMSRSDVFLYDFQADTNVMVSRSLGMGGVANNDSRSPDISPDGRFVAYLSDATDIVDGDFNESGDVFLYDRLSGVTTLLSASREGAASGDNHSMAPWFSADGSTLLWTSWASDQVDVDHNHFGDVFAFNLPPSAITDNDGDGMDDQWELDYFMTTARNGTNDFDLDGASDLFEFQTCSVPTNAASLFRGEIVFTASPSSQVELTWTAAPGKGYRVEWKASLSDPQWQDLGAAISVLGSTGTAFDVNVSPGRKFYRITLISP